ncbi:MAG TPA: Trm112 family protein [bacterium]|nr:Trm112 family protein [bacterium]
MKQWLMDILQCPICRNEKLSLKAVEVNGDEITWGVILCDACKRWFPIINSIPHMLPDEFRKKEDKEFAERVSKLLEGIKLELRPPRYKAGNDITRLG